MQSLSGDTLFFGLIIAVHIPIFRKWVYHTLLVDPTLHVSLLLDMRRAPACRPDVQNRSFCCTSLVVAVYVNGELNIAKAVQFSFPFFGCREYVISMFASQLPSERHNV